MLKEQSKSLVIGVTGSEGLVGTALCKLLVARGHVVKRFDLRLKGVEKGYGDVLDASRVAGFVNGCDGIVHLAAVSRVISGERDPVLCEKTNVGGTRIVVGAAIRDPGKPFVILASSREVYGEPVSLPVSETAVRSPINVYGRSKVSAEDLVLAANGDGVRTAVLRLSNVYGSTEDHLDRVVPAFALAAALGGELRVEGGDHTFDFTHLDDTVRGIVTVVERLASGESGFPPIHLLTGRPTTLRRLAEIAVAAGGNRARLIEAPPRNYDVGQFVGDPSKAAALLGWRAERHIEDGVVELVKAFRAQRRAKFSVAGGAW